MPQSPAGQVRGKGFSIPSAKNRMSLGPKVGLDNSKVPETRPPGNKALVERDSAHERGPFFGWVCRGAEGPPQAQAFSGGPQ